MTHRDQLLTACNAALIGGLSAEMKQSIDRAWASGATKHGIMKAVRRGAGGKGPLLIEAVRAYLETK